MIPEGIHYTGDAQWVTDLLNEAVSQAETMMECASFEEWPNVGIWQGAIDNVADDRDEYADLPESADRAEVAGLLQSRLKDPLPRKE